MGPEREQPPGQVLHLDGCGASPAARGNGRLEPLGVRDGRGFTRNVGGGLRCSSAFVRCFVFSRGGVILKRECPKSCASTSSNTSTTWCAPACPAKKRPA